MAGWWGGGVAVMVWYLGDQLFVRVVRPPTISMAMTTRGEG